jgi:hypothetical protein
LDISSNNIGVMVPPHGWKGPDSRGCYTSPAGEILYNAPASSKPEGAIAFADAIRDNRALTTLHVGKNNIPEKEMREIMDIAMRMDSVKILCEVPFKDKTLTELDVSGKDLGMEGALVVAEYLDGNRAMTSLNLASNKLDVEGAKIIAVCLPKCK